MNRIFVDFEMTPVPKNMRQVRACLKNEIIQIGAVMLGDSGEKVSEFGCYVRPSICKEVPAHITELTGISSETVFSEGIEIEEALRMFSEWCGSDFWIYAWSENDLKQFVTETRYKRIDLGAAGAALTEKWTDFQREFSDLLNLHQILRLQEAVFIGGLDFAGRAHDGLIDARNTAALYSRSADEAFRERFRGYVRTREEPMTASLGSLFDFSALELAV